MSMLQASKEVQASCEKKIHDAMTEKNAIAKRLELLEKDLEDANNENIRLTNESQSLVSSNNPHFKKI